MKPKRWKIAALLGVAALGALVAVKATYGHEFINSRIQLSAKIGRVAISKNVPVGEQGRERAVVRVKEFSDLDDEEKSDAIMGAIFVLGVVGVIAYFALCF